MTALPSVTGAFGVAAMTEMGQTGAVDDQTARGCGLSSQPHKSLNSSYGGETLTISRLLKNYSQGEKTRAFWDKCAEPLSPFPLVIPFSI